jgi:ABC-type sugar transport system ATPase subunit
MLNLVDDRGMRKRSREVLEALAEDLDQCKRQGMSGGSAAVFAIARALLWAAASSSMNQLQRWRRKAKKCSVIATSEHDVSVIVVSHNMQQLMSIADRITVMRPGRHHRDACVKNTQVRRSSG